MLKKMIWTVSLISILGLVNCGGGSKEAKELLQKILQLIGIPHSIVVNICQDTNKNGFCGEGELFTKVTINKGDSVETIWEKISLTADGRYFLETYNPELPILLELQDATKVNYDAGKFHLAFNGFKTKEDDNETKELSILASMIDANHLTNQDVQSIRNLNTKSTQDKFYASLLSALEENVNILRGVDINQQNTMSANIKLMAEKLIADGVRTTLADSLNACATDEACVDKILEGLTTNLLITDAEAQEVKKEQSSTNSNTNKIDLRDYKPLSSIDKNFIYYAQRKGEDETTSSLSQSLTVEGNVISESITILGELISTQTITIETNLIRETTPNSDEITYNRYVSVGDILYSIPLNKNEGQTGDYTCRVHGKVNDFTKRGYTYSGELLIIKCIQDSVLDNGSTKTTSHGEWFEYLNKNISLVVKTVNFCSNNGVDPEYCTNQEMYYLE